MAEGGVDTVREKSVEAGAFVDLVEVGQSLAFVEDAGAVARGDGWVLLSMPTRRRSPLAMS